MYKFLVFRKKYNLVLVLSMATSIGIGMVYMYTTEATQTESFLYRGELKTDFYDELKNRYIEISETKGVSTALSLLEEDSRTNGQIAALCHDILHEVGDVAFRQANSISEAIKSKTDFCNSGYIHGVFEAYFKSTSYNPQALMAICSKYAAEESLFDLWQCHHGIGHGLMYVTDGDLEVSLSRCKEVVDAKFVQDCQNGVLMEVFNGEFLPLENQNFPANNPFDICQGFTDLKGTCYMYAPTYLSINLQMEYTEILNECNQIDPTYKNNCVSGVITEATKRNMNNLETVFSLCSRMKDEGEQKRCATSIVKMYLNQTGSIDVTKSFCSTVPEEYSLVCITTVEDSEAFFLDKSNTQ